MRCALSAMRSVLSLCIVPQACATLAGLCVYHPQPSVWGGPSNKTYGMRIQRLTPPQELPPKRQKQRWRPDAEWQTEVG